LLNYTCHIIVVAEFLVAELFVAKIVHILQDHKSDAEFLNKPIENFEEMHTIFGSTMATGLFAKDSGVALGTNEESIDDWDSEVQRMEIESDRGATQGDNAATSSATNKATIPNKRDKGKKRARTDQDELVAAIKWGSTKLAKAIKEAGKSDNDVPADLYDNVMGMPGFNSTYLSFYHSYLVQHPHIARAFNSLTFEHKLNWVAKHNTDN
jgi:hypothetical protein